MRFCITESMTDPSYFPALARTAEECGFDGFMVPDSICYPAEADTDYPYNSDGTREFLDDKPFIEPMSLIPCRAARIGGGWTAAAADDEFMAHAISRLTELRKGAGRDHLPFRILLGTVHGFDPDGVKRLEEQGVTDLYVGFRDPYVAGPDTQSL